jgi:hypothetical protein
MEQQCDKLMHQEMRKFVSGFFEEKPGTNNAKQHEQKTTGRFGAQLQ